MRKGQGSKTNMFFRYRLYAQAFTIVAMLGGSYYYNADRLLRKEYDDLQEMKKKQEKRDRWIKELEARDEEDKEWREKLGKVRDMKREEAEKAVMEEKNRREGRSEGGKGIVKAAKEKLKEARDLEALREDKEEETRLAAVARQKRVEMERKQEARIKEQRKVKEGAKMGPDTRVWGESGGGLLGWKRIRNFWRTGSARIDEEDGDNQEERPK